MNIWNALVNVTMSQKNFQLGADLVHARAAKNTVQTFHLRVRTSGMATLQREVIPSTTSVLPPSSLLTQFDPLAVPSPYEPTASTSSTYEDLLDLSEEPLFSGARTGKPVRRELDEAKSQVVVDDAIAGIGVVEEVRLILFVISSIAQSSCSNCSTYQNLLFATGTYEVTRSCQTCFLDRSPRLDYSSRNVEWQQHHFNRRPGSE